MDIISNEWRKARAESAPLALLVHQSLRRPLRRLLRRAAPGMGFIAYGEVPGDMRIAPIALLRQEDIFAADERRESGETLRGAAA
jgi:flagellar biosynthesis component FlhA